VTTALANTQAHTLQVRLLQSRLDPSDRTVTLHVTLDRAGQDTVPVTELFPLPQMMMFSTPINEPTRP